ncbi:MAG: protein kinase [Phenylobacterium sp.]|uniref:protein kinase domain-containing protein n=1 Tax=Phenylobacterium sp. TaxID=1871053 RepID=UPI0025D15AAD|nr:serine/threonine-protein kinase [Phenylobacterium sp.]MBI1197490.1 protein kinase [Phenylobacterium sp.]
MARPTDPEVERAALALFERLNAAPRSRGRILKGVPTAVRARAAALEAGADAAEALMSTGPGAGLISPPERVGPFRLTELIGMGGMGGVWRAERDDGLYEQVVAVKFIHAELGEAAAERFAVERRLLAKLETPTIARLIDGGVTADGVPYLVMEYVEGLPIDEAVAGQPLPDAVRRFADAAEAVQFAHSRLVVHGDLKPSNILVDRDGRVRLLDFGVARLLDAEADDGPAPLTRAYASPERLAGGPPSIADDVHALGVMLRELAGGRADADLAAIADRAAAPVEADRYGSVAAMIADLERWRDRLPVSARPNSVAYRARLFMARHAVGVTASALAILALTATAVVATANYLTAERARTQAEQRFGEVRALSRYMLFPLYDRLAGAPGTVEARAELAATARRYLDRLAASPDAPADLRLEIAQGYRRLARVQGVSGVASLGRPSEAAVSLAAAERLADQLRRADPRAAEPLELLGWIEADRWTLAPDNADSARINARARTDFDQALALDPNRPLARLGLIETQKNRAYDLIWAANKPADAIPILHAALADLRARRIGGEEARLLEVNLLNRLGDATYNAGDVPGSLGPYREAERLVDARLARGEALEWLAAKGESDWNVSGSLGDTGQLEPALAKARHGVSTMQRVLSYGSDAHAEKRLLILYGQEAGLLAELGRHRDAIEPALQSVTLREARAALEPDDPQRARDLAIGLETASHVFARGGRRAEACRLATRSAERWAMIAARGRLSKRDAEKNQPAAAKARDDYCR